MTVHRIEVRTKTGWPDTEGRAVQREIASLHLPSAPNAIDTASVYLIECDLSDDDLKRIAREVFADAVSEQIIVGASSTNGAATVEIHPLPGVIDPDAEPIEQAIRTTLSDEVSVRTGRRYDMHGVDAQTAVHIAERLLANRMIHHITDRPYHPDAFPTGSQYDLTVREVPLDHLDDEGLMRLSREGHLFLNLEEMRAIQAEYRKSGRPPREIELETIAQTWSEHCVHKTLKATYRYTQDQSHRKAFRWHSADQLAQRPGHTLNDDGSITIENLMKSTIAAATQELIDDGIDWCLSVFVDNSGVIAFDDEHAVCFKVETHNHPSALEPYGGAATGIGGCIRDIIGTGLAARPIANTDVFCVAHPDHYENKEFTTEDTESTEKDTEKKKDNLDELNSHNDAHDSNFSEQQTTSIASVSSSVPFVLSVVKPLPSGCLHPRRILQQVVAGVRDYGNRMGIPTLNGAVWFHDDYIGNPLVFAGCVGVMPRDKIKGAPQFGDHIIALGGRTGRDGIHGATFSSAELTSGHGEEFSHAVQIGNPVTEKKLLDAILKARDHHSGCLFHAITDCGAGGFSSAIGEMGEQLGAEVHLERAPLKYAGLSPTEIWISEAQERMVLAVPPEHIPTLHAICDEHDVEMCDLGQFGTEQRDLILFYNGNQVGRLPMQFLHEGIPQTTRHAHWTPPPPPPPPPPEGKQSSEPASTAQEPTIKQALLRLLAHPNIASKHWIIRQYDHEVQGGTIIKPLVGANGEGPSDAAVIQPVFESQQGLAIANGLATGFADDPYVMTLNAIDECARNLVCVGADPARIAILDNFCWPGVTDPQRLGELVRAAEACYDGAKAYRTPFISGKDSLNNQFTSEDGPTITIPPTLLISGFGIVSDIEQCITMDAKQAGNVLVLVGGTQPRMRGSHFEMCFGRNVVDDDRELPCANLEFGPMVARCVHEMIAAGCVHAAHDVSDGGLLVAAAEMAFAGGLGLDLNELAAHLASHSIHPIKACFGEGPSTYLLEVTARDAETTLPRMIQSAGLPDETCAVIGAFNDSSRLTLDNHLDVDLQTMLHAWRGTLDW